MTIKEYHENVTKQLTSLKRVKTKTITAEKYLEPIRQLIGSWGGIQDALANGQDTSVEVKQIGIVISDLATESGKEKRPRLKLVGKLRNLKNLLYPLTLKKELGLSGSGLVVFHDNQEFALYTYLKNQITVGKTHVLILDGYVSEGTLNILYGLPRDITIKILTKSPDTMFTGAWKKFNKEYKKAEIRKNSNVHDRLVIVDDRSFMSGPSLKDAGNKPTLLCHFDKIDSKKAQNFFELFWKKGKRV